ncbi:MAG: tripartite tricarboxylate transporter substrate binding protein [Betaproteobacteria bacterium]|nr:tripartite tricarboxylate transporter substrate binding protein [Betaproteobacteria bacterium]
MKLVSRSVLTAAIIAASCFMHSFALAQPYPSRTVRFVVPFPPGGGTDTVARILAQKVTESWIQRVVVENRPGAQGNIGTAYVAKAPPDGYTLILAYVGTMAIAPWLYKDLGYDPIRDFAHVSQLSSQPILIVVHPSIPAKDLKGLVALAKAKPDTLAYASTGQFPQMAGELFKSMTGTKMIHVPYKGAGPATTDLLGGHISLMFASPASAVHVKTGRLRALAVTGSSRLSTLPDVPTVTEVGYSYLEMSGWYGVSAPRGTPADVLARLNSEFAKAAALPQVQEALNRTGIESVGNSAEEFTRYVKAEYERWGKIVKQSGVKAE